MKPQQYMYVRQEGFTLIEVLVAVVILAIGLLGTAGLQVYGLKNIDIAGNHAQATILAHELAERMHMNNSDASVAGYITPIPCPNTTDRAKMDYCEIKSKGEAVLRLFRDPGSFAVIPLISVAACASCTGAGMYSITVNWAEKDIAGTDQLQTYRFNLKP
jgi:type IV pilus assembly protein PilV